MLMLINRVLTGFSANRNLHVTSEIKPTVAAQTIQGINRQGTVTS